VKIAARVEKKYELWFGMVLIEKRGSKGQVSESPEK
jgi:hypothetical protein